MLLPVLPVNDVDEAIEWYKETLGFSEDLRQPGPDGKTVAGQVSSHGSQIMFNLNPPMAGNAGGGVFFWIRVDEIDIDAYYDELKSKGVTVTDEIKDQYWGDRSFTVNDLNGYILAFNKKL